MTTPHAPVDAPSHVQAVIRAVAEVTSCHLLDAASIASICQRMGEEEFARWIAANPGRYAAAIIYGFVD